MDTLESVFHYTDPERVIVIDDTKGTGIDFSHVEGVVLPSVGHDIFGGLYLNLAMAYRYVVENVQFDMLLRLDTDALLLGDGLVQAAMSRFESNLKIGALGRTASGLTAGNATGSLPEKYSKRSWEFEGCGIRQALAHSADFGCISAWIHTWRACASSGSCVSRTDNHRNVSPRPPRSRRSYKLPTWGRSHFRPSYCRRRILYG